MEGARFDFAQEVDASGNFDDFVGKGEGEEEDLNNEELVF